MAKRLVAKVGEYQKENETKGEYAEVGVILSGDNGEFALLDPGVNIAGLLIRQNALAAKHGKPQRDKLMVSIFEKDNQNQQHSTNNQQGGYQQQPQQQGGYQQQNNGFDDPNYDPGF